MRKYAQQKRDTSLLPTAVFLTVELRAYILTTQYFYGSVMRITMTQFLPSWSFSILA